MKEETGLMASFGNETYYQSDGEKDTDFIIRIYVRANEIGIDKEDIKFYEYVRIRPNLEVRYN